MVEVPVAVEGGRVEVEDRWIVVAAGALRRARRRRQPVEVVGEQVEAGQTVQFHIRDARAADEDLRRTLEREAAALGGRRAAGALLFTCNGRGSRMFSEPGHDAGLLAKMLGEVPVAGFFCAGELGPVGGQNYLHAYTASIAVFPAAAPEA